MKSGLRNEVARLVSTGKTQSGRGEAAARRTRVYFQAIGLPLPSLMLSQAFSTSSTVACGMGM